MKFTFTFLSLALFSVAVFAQPSFTSTPVVVDKASFDEAEIDYTGLHPKTTAGANQTWDYSTLDLSSAINKTITVHSSLTGSAHASSFPTATFYDSDTETEGYYQITGNSYNYVGDYEIPDGFAVNYTDPQTIYSTPFNYNDRQNDTYLTNYNDGSSQVSENGILETLFDGYGTLILPQGSLNNIARLRIIITDTTVFTEGSNVATYAIKDTIYYWMKPGDYAPTLSISYGYLHGLDISYDNSNIQLEVITSALPTGILNNISYTQASVYPQPASGAVTIAGKSLNGSCAVTISNLQGETIVSESQTAADELLNLDVSTLKTGLYVLEILNEERHYRQKLIVK